MVLDSGWTARDLRSENAHSHKVSCFTEIFCPKLKLFLISGFLPVHAEYLRWDLLALLMCVNVGVTSIGKRH
jgi:hypothetical protein